MKKCPYCKTLMNNDSKTCPNCLKDMSNLEPMSEVAPKDNKISFYTLAFGLIIGCGSVFASLSQRMNRINYQKQYDECLEKYNATSIEATREELYNQAQSIMVNIKTCQFREIAFYIMCGIGVAMVLYAVISFIVKKTKSKKLKK